MASDDCQQEIHGNAEVVAQDQWPTQGALEAIAEADAPSRPDSNIDLNPHYPSSEDAEGSDTESLQGPPSPVSALQAAEDYRLRMQAEKTAGVDSPSGTIFQGQGMVEAELQARAQQESNHKAVEEDVPSMREQADCMQEIAE